MVDLFLLDTVASCEFLRSIAPGRIGKDKSTMWQLRKWMPMLPKRSAMLETENTLQTSPLGAFYISISRDHDLWSSVVPCISIWKTWSVPSCYELKTSEITVTWKLFFWIPSLPQTRRTRHGEADELLPCKRRIIPYLSPQASVKPNIPKLLQVQLAKVIPHALSAQWTSPITCGC